MEHLDSKYFERVIAALKQARDSQTIEINENFKRTLRARIEERALTVTEPAEPSWVEWVLKSRYILGGVPVMAALVLVTMAALNHNVPMDSQMLAETREVSEVKTTNVMVTQDLPVAGKADLLAESLPRFAESPTKPGLVTFSAELVMPPAEVLAAREAYLRGRESGAVQLSAMPTLQTIQTVPSSPAYTFFEGAINSVWNIPMPQAEPSVSAVRVEQTIVPAMSTELNSTPAESPGQTAVPATVVETIPMKDQILVNSVPAKPSMPPEASAKLTVAEPDEQIITENTQSYYAIDKLAVPVAAPTEVKSTGSNVVEPTVTQPLSGPATVSRPTPVTASVTPSVIAPISAPVAAPTLPETYMVVDPAKGTFEKIEVAPVQTVDTVPSIVAEPVAEEAKSSSSYDFRSEPLVSLAEAEEVHNQPLLAERIYFRGDLREKLVRAVMLALAVRDGNLSRDYYVNIVKAPDNTYRATLYEHGQSRTVLVIAAQRTGEYRVITQLNY